MNRRDIFNTGYLAGYLDALDAAKGPPDHMTTIHKVEIKVNSNQDPSRIAKEVVGVLNEESRKPKGRND